MPRTSTKRTGPSKQPWEITRPIQKEWLGIVLAWLAQKYKRSGLELDLRKKTEIYVTWKSLMFSKDLIGIFISYVPTFPGYGISSLAPVYGFLRAMKNSFVAFDSITNELLVELTTGKRKIVKFEICFALFFRNSSTVSNSRVRAECC